MTSELTGKELGLLGSLILASKFLPSKTVLVDEVELASSQVSTVSGTKTSSVQTTIGQSIKQLRQELGIQGVFAWNTELARAYESKLARLVGISSQAFADAFVQSGVTTHPSIADIVAQLHNRANYASSSIYSIYQTLASLQAGDLGMLLHQIATVQANLMTTNANVTHVQQSVGQLLSQVGQLDQDLIDLTSTTSLLEGRVATLEGRDPGDSGPINSALLSSPLRMLSFGPLFAWNGILDRANALVDPRITMTTRLFPEIAQDQSDLRQLISVSIIAGEDAEFFTYVFLRDGIPPTIDSQWLSYAPFNDAYISFTSLHPGSFPLRLRAGKLSRVTITVPFDVSNLWNMSGSCQISLDIYKHSEWLLSYEITQQLATDDVAHIQLVTFVDLTDTVTVPEEPFVEVRFRLRGVAYTGHVQEALNSPVDEVFFDYVVRTLHIGYQVAPGLFPASLSEKTLVPNEVILYASESQGLYFGLNQPNGIFFPANEGFLELDGTRSTLVPSSASGQPYRLDTLRDLTRDQLTHLFLDNTIKTWDEVKGTLDLVTDAQGDKYVVVPIYVNGTDAMLTDYEGNLIFSRLYAFTYMSGFDPLTFFSLQKALSTYRFRGPNKRVWAEIQQIESVEYRTMPGFQIDESHRALFAQLWRQTVDSIASNESTLTVGSFRYALQNTTQSALAYNFDLDVIVSKYEIVTSCVVQSTPITTAILKGDLFVHLMVDLYESDLTRTQANSMPALRSRLDQVHDLLE